MTRTQRLLVTSNWDKMVTAAESPGILGGGFNFLLFSSLLGQNSNFDEHIFQMGGSTTN